MFKRHITMAAAVLAALVTATPFADAQSPNAGPPATTPSGTPIRRVVTGLDASGKAKVMFDGELQMASARTRFPAGDVWVTPGSPTDFSFTEDRSKNKTVAPPPGGTIFRVVEFTQTTPEAEKAMDPQLMMKVVGDHAPRRGLPTTHPMMHRTRTLDYAIVLSGEIDMVLDDSTVHLKQGDLIVQQATNHAWVNRSPTPCRVAFVLIDSVEP